MTGESVGNVLVDVGIPTYRRPDYVVEAIESVLAQSLRDWRLTISENGEGGGEIEAAVRPYLDDPRISYMATERVVPLQQNWNGLIRRGSAPYLALLHDDDRWHPEWLARRVTFLDEHPGCGFVFSPATIVTRAGEPLVRLRAEFEEGIVPRDTIVRRLLLNNVVPVSSILIRRATLDAAGAYVDERFLFCCDWELWLRLALQGPAGFVDASDNDYRKHELQLTYNDYERPKQIALLFDHFDRLVKRDFPALQLGRLERARGRSRVLLTMALDAFEGGGRRPALVLYARALGTYPPALVDSRSLALLATLPFGRRGSRALERGRWSIHRRAIRTHLRGGMGWRTQKAAPSDSADSEN